VNNCVHLISDPWDPILLVLRGTLIIVDQLELDRCVLLTQLNFNC